MKFNNQSIDPVNRNDFISKVFKENSIHRYKYFKYFFALVDLRCSVLKKKLQPNYKVNEFFSHFCKVLLEVYDPESNLSTDEQDQRFTRKGDSTVR